MEAFGICRDPHLISELIPRISIITRIECAEEVNIMSTRLNSDPMSYR